MVSDVMLGTSLIVEGSTETGSVGVIYVASMGSGAGEDSTVGSIESATIRVGGSVTGSTESVTGIAGDGSKGGSAKSITSTGDSSGVG